MVNFEFNKQFSHDNDRCSRKFMDVYLLEKTLKSISTPLAKLITNIIHICV